MIKLKYEEIINIVNVFNKKILADNSRIGKIQRAYSTPHFISLQVRVPGENIFLSIGRGSGYEGMWLSETRPPSEFRVVDRYLEFLRKHLVGESIKLIQNDENDRIIAVRCIKKTFYFFWKGPNLYFAMLPESKEEKSFFSWSGWVDGVEHYGFDLFNEIGRVNIEKHSTTRENLSKLEEMYYDWLRNKLEKSNHSPKKMKFLEKKAQKILSDLERVKDASLVKEYLSAHEVKFENHLFLMMGVKIKIPKSLDYYKSRDYIFGKLKSYAEGEKILQKRLQATRAEIEDFLKNKCRKIDISKMKIIQPSWPDGKKGPGASDQTNIKKQENVQFFKLGDKSCAIGKSVSGNDYIRIHWAKREDLWFHLDVVSSPHIIIKVDNISRLSTLELEALVSMLISYSGREMAEATVIYTQVKNLKGLKGQAGSVTYKKQKYLTIKYNKSWKEIISTI